MSCKGILAHNALFRKLRQITKVAVGLITAFAIIGCGGGDTNSNFSQIRIAELQAAPADIEFGNVSVGGKSSQTLNLTNIGEAELTITQAQVTGTGFSISGPSLPLAIPAGESVAINAVFSPKSSGDAKGSISFISNGVNSPTTVSLSGTGLQSMLSVSPASVDFGTVTVGNSAALAGSLANTGNTSLTVSEMSATGTGFSVSGPGLPLTLAAGQSASFSVTFSPQASGSVTITSNAANSPVVETLSGTGANPHSVSLSWKASSSADVMGYNVYRSSISGGPYMALNGLLVTGT